MSPDKEISELGFDSENFFNVVWCGQSNYLWGLTEVRIEHDLSYALVCILLEYNLLHGRFITPENLAVRAPCTPYLIF